MKKQILCALAGVTLMLTGCTQPTTAPTPAATATTPATASTPTPAASETPAESPAGTPGDTSQATPSGAGEEVVMDAVGIKYSIPAGWKKATPDGNMLTSADETLAIVFIEPQEADVKKVLEGIGTMMEEKIKDMKVTNEAAEHEVNGMSWHSLSGTGKIDGKDVEWAVEVLGVKKPLIILEFAEAGAYEKNQATYDAFEESFVSIDGAGDATPSGDEASASPDASEGGE